MARTFSAPPVSIKTAPHRGAVKSGYARFAELSPLLEKSLAEWLAARRSDTAYYCGEYAQAAELARQAKDPFHDKIAEELSRMVARGADATPLAPQRVLLEVGFVRQHHQTCAPAVLASLSRFWKMPADHLEVAAAICSDGTPPAGDDSRRGGQCTLRSRV